MKIRICYVSNSSSASFLVSEDLTSKGIACLKLTQAQKEMLNGSLIQDGEVKVGINLTKDLYLTEFVSDCDDKKWDIIESVEHMVYENGQMCGEPYSDDDVYNEYLRQSEIWWNAKCLSVNLLKNLDIHIMNKGI